VVFCQPAPPPASAPTDPGRKEPPHPAQPPPRRILAVDDNKDAVESLALLLTMMGHEVRVAYEGFTAMDAARTYEPEVVLLDIGLPGMDGYQVARWLRRQPALAKVLLIAVTGYSQPEDRRRSREAGFDYHMAKPVDLDVLERLLAHPPSLVSPEAPPGFPGATGPGSHAA
jgi:CheY-like chemotaxis protein